MNEAGTIGGCIDTNLKTLMSIMDSTSMIANPECFVNPQMTMIHMIQNGGYDRKSAILTLLHGGSLESNMVHDNIEFHNALVDMLGGQKLIEGVNTTLPPFGYIIGGEIYKGAMPQFTSLTEFLSGRMAAFPMDAFDHSLVPNIAIIGALGFAGLIGVAEGAQMTDNMTCQLDSEHPCGWIDKIFGAIMSAFNSVLQAIAAGMADIMLTIQKVLDFINQIIGKIQECLQAIIDAILKVMRWALAKLLNGMKMDPCLGAVLSQIAGPALGAALHL